MCFWKRKLFANFLMFCLVFDVQNLVANSNSLPHCSKVKMVNELLEGIHLIASVEAISLGVQFGIHPWILYDIISNAAGNSWFVATCLVFLFFFPWWQFHGVQSSEIQTQEKKKKLATTDALNSVDGSVVGWCLVNF